MENLTVKINGVLYRFDYKFHIQVNTDILLAVNIILIIIFIKINISLLFLKRAANHANNCKQHACHRPYNPTVTPVTFCCKIMINMVHYL